MKQPSIQSRFLWALLVVLPFFLGIMALGLDHAYRNSSLQDEEEKLTLNILNTLSQLEISGSESNDMPYEAVMPEAMQDPEFNRPSSGFYAYVYDDQERLLWASSSTATERQPLLHPVLRGPKQPGAYQFYAEAVDGLLIMQHQSLWKTQRGEAAISLVIAKSRSWHQEKLYKYRQTLWLSLFAITLLLTALLYSIIRWGLHPLTSLSSQVKELESGKKDKLEGKHPKELAPLVNNLQQLINTERDQRERYRNTLADLAHSLKTPLAIVNSLNIDDETVKQHLNEQVDSMNRIVEYQLQRAVSASAHKLMAQVNIANVANRISGVLKKVYTERAIHCQNNIEETVSFIGDERDLMELLGNLLDNAFKYTKSSVCVTATNAIDKSSISQISIVIEDDGPGIPEEKRVAILQRGQRADTLQAGQGIGLAVAMDIIESYQGKLSIETSSLGGAKFVITLPGKI